MIPLVCALNFGYSNPVDRGGYIHLTMKQEKCPDFHAAECNHADGATYHQISGVYEGDLLPSFHSNQTGQRRVSDLDFNI